MIGGACFTPAPRLHEKINTYLEKHSLTLQQFAFLVPASVGRLSALIAAATSYHKQDPCAARDYGGWNRLITNKIWEVLYREDPHSRLVGVEFTPPRKKINIGGFEDMDITGLVKQLSKKPKVSLLDFSEALKKIKHTL